MLENLASLLLSSMESFAGEELSLWLARISTERRYYVPVIVTNARLTICNFDVAAVSLEAGEIPEGDFEEVPYIRFRKSLATTLSENSSAQTVSAANRDKNRTVFVVHSSNLAEFMTDWYLTLSGGNRLPNW